MSGYFKVLRLSFQREYISTDQLFTDLFNASRLDNSLIYRGISKDYEKRPGITRVKNGKEVVNLYRKEFTMLREFRKNSTMLLDGQYSPIDFVSCAQHFGVPTRLLDWTTDPFVALYFALVGEPHEDDEGTLTYRILHCNKRNQIVLNDIGYLQTYDDVSRYHGDQLLATYERFINDIQSPDSLKKICKGLHVSVPMSSLNSFIVLDPNRSNPRLTAQKGLFIIPRSLDKTKVEDEYGAAGVQTITINPQLRDEALSELSNMGYSRINLFFDLQNIAQHIKDEALKKF